MIFFLKLKMHCTDPEAYYYMYTTGTLNGLHEMERFEDGTKRFGNETKRFGDGTKRISPDIQISSHGESAFCFSSLRKIRISFIYLDQLVRL